MMKNLETLKNLDWRAGGRIMRLGESPEMDWKIIFVSAAALAVVTIALNIFMFVRIDKREIFVVDATLTQGSSVIDLDILRSTLSYYQSKAIEFEKIKSGTIPVVVDPSL